MKIREVGPEMCHHIMIIPNNLISLGQLMDNGYLAIFMTTGIKFKSSNDITFVESQKIGQMYQMRELIKITSTAWDCVATAKEWTLDKWHCILGHVKIWTIKTILKNGLVTGLLIDDMSQEPTQCTACIQGKWHVEPFPREATEKAKKIGDLIVSDVWDRQKLKDWHTRNTSIPIWTRALGTLGSILGIQRMKH